MLIVIKTLAITSFGSQQEEWVSSTLYTKEEKLLRVMKWLVHISGRAGNSVCLTWNSWHQGPMPGSMVSCTNDQQQL